MKLNHFRKFGILSLLMIAVVSGCVKEWKDAIGTGPEITISKSEENITSVNVGDKVTIPVKVTSPTGVKRLSYFFILKTSNGTESGPSTHIDRDDFPKDLQYDIEFVVKENMTELVVVSFNKENFSSEKHISISEIRKLPILTFKDGIKFQQTVFENREIAVEGNITSESDLKSISFQTLINGTYSAETPIAFTDKRNTPFTAKVNAVNGLTAVIIKASTIYEGKVADTFKIGSVAEDAVSIALSGGIANIPILYADSLNSISGIASSGSNFQKITYAIRKNGVFGTETDITLGTPLTEFPFTFSFTGEKNMDAIRIKGENKGGKTQEKVYTISKVYTKLLHFPSIVLTTEIGPGKNNWFSAYQAPHVFDITNAAQNQTMLDFAFIKYTSSANRIVPAAVFAANAAYFNATAPYMVGFSKAPYSMITANRPHVTPEALAGLRWDGEMEDWLQANIIAPVAQGGENYNIKSTNRRVSGDMVKGSGFVMGWGTWNFVNGSAVNDVFGIIVVKDYVEANGFATVTLDIKVPAEDNRTKYNPVSIHNYP